MRITKAQQDYLNTLVCQRITDDKANREVIETFINRKNPGLPAALRQGWNADAKDKVAYYIVKEPDLKDETGRKIRNGEPLLFFSLKCGEIDVPYNLEKLRQALENSEALLDAAYGLDAPEWAKDIVEKRKENGVLPKRKFLEFYMRHRRNQQKWALYSEEIRLEGENIVRTKQTLAGVELVHFCVHTPAAEKWKILGNHGQSLGKTMFWKFVVPIIQEVRSLVGCEYLYLFAADDKKCGRLVNYYKELGFEIRDDLSVSKPEYDFCCFFMCQKITSLRNRQNKFFRNYNGGED